MPPEISRTGRRLNGSIGQTLGSAIVHGDFLAGDNLPNEIEFAKELDISRSAYREVVRFLASKGLLECRPQSGTSIRHRREWNLLDPDVLEWASQGPFGAKLYEDLSELRMTVEPSAASVAAKRRTEGDLATLEECLTIVRDCHDDTAVKKAVAAFHVGILVATRNDFLVTLGPGIRVAIESSFPTASLRGQVNFRVQYSRLHASLVRQDSKAAAQIMQSLVQYFAVAGAPEIPR